MLGTPVDLKQNLSKDSKVIGINYTMQTHLYFLNQKYYILPAFGRTARELTEDEAREYFPDAFDSNGKPIVPPTQPGDSV